MKLNTFLRFSVNFYTVFMVSLIMGGLIAQQQNFVLGYLIITAVGLQGLYDELRVRHGTLQQAPYFELTSLFTLTILSSLAILFKLYFNDAVIIKLSSAMSLLSQRSIGWNEIHTFALVVSLVVLMGIQCSIIVRSGYALKKKVWDKCKY